MDDARPILVEIATFDDLSTASEAIARLESKGITPEVSREAGTSMVMPHASPVKLLVREQEAEQALAILALPDGTLAATPSERMRVAQRRLSCPKCQSAFVRQEVDGTPVLSCAGCGGIWFTAGGMSAFLKKAAQAGGDAVPLAIEPEETPVPTEIGCPSCESGGMDTIKVRGVALDRCWECHGIYIDLGELEEVVGPISPPNRHDPEPVLVSLLGWLAR